MSADLTAPLVRALLAELRDDRLSPELRLLLPKVIERLTELQTLADAQPRRFGPPSILTHIPHAYTPDHNGECVICDEEADAPCHSMEMPSPPQPRREPFPYDEAAARHTERQLPHAYTPDQNGVCIWCDGTFDAPGHNLPLPPEHE